MAQMARSLPDCGIRCLLGKRYLIIDRDSIFSPRFKAMLEGAESGSY